MPQEPSICDRKTLPPHDRQAQHPSHLKPYLTDSAPKPFSQEFASIMPVASSPLASPSFQSALIRHLGSTTEPEAAALRRYISLMHHSRSNGAHMPMVDG